MIINRFFYAPPAPVYTVSTLAPSLVAKAGSDAAASNYLSTVAAYNNGSFNGGGADNTAFNSAYNTYVSTLPGGGFGRTDSISDTGSIYWSPGVFSLASTFAPVNFVVGNPCSFTTTNITDYNYVNIKSDNAVSASVSGTYTFAGDFSYPSSLRYQFRYVDDTYPPHGHFNSGSSFLPAGDWLNTAWYPSPVFTVSLAFRWKITPDSSSIITTDYPTSSRVNTVINNYAVKNEDNTYNYITNKPIFDENTLTFYDPHTGVYFNVTAWNYDYSTRRYTLTYTDNSVSKTATVEYGYNYITVTADGATINYYYIA